MGDKGARAGLVAHLDAGKGFGSKGVATGFKNRMRAEGHSWAEGGVLDKIVFDDAGNPRSVDAMKRLINKARKKTGQSTFIVPKSPVKSSAKGGGSKSTRKGRTAKPR